MSEQVIGSDDQSLQLSSRLAKKLSKQVPPYQNSYFKPFYKNLGLYYRVFFVTGPPLKKYKIMLKYPDWASQKS